MHSRMAQLLLAVQMLGSLGRLCLNAQLCFSLQRTLGHNVMVYSFLDIPHT